MEYKIICRFYKNLGACRVVLARELTLAEIVEMRREIPKDRYRPEPLQGGEGLMNAGQVQYVCRGGNFRDLGKRSAGCPASPRFLYYNFQLSIILL